MFQYFKCFIILYSDLDMRKDLSRLGFCSLCIFLRKFQAIFESSNNFLTLCRKFNIGHFNVNFEYSDTYECCNKI